MTSSKLATRVIGIDVSKDKLDISDSEGKIKKEVKNSTASIVKYIVKKIAKPGEAFVVCEATGGYERTLVKAMQTAGVAACIANPFQVRQFAEGIGVLEKSDPIDAEKGSRNKPCCCRRAKRTGNRPGDNIHFDL